MDLVGLLLKGLLGQKEGWLRRALEAEIWQLLSLALMRELGSQLVWGTFRSDVAEGPVMVHEPYA
jgi:hypothetical protein